VVFACKAARCIIREVYVLHVYARLVRPLLPAGELRYPHRQNLEVINPDFQLIAGATLKLIDPKDAITTIVVPAGTDPRARKALANFRKVISPAQVPQSVGYTLPAGYFLLQTFRITEGEALFEGQLGPVTTSLAAVNIPDCGKIYSVPFFLYGDDWVGRSYKVTDCSQSRHWVPIDEIHDWPGSEIQ
jgi:hypothetical protein